MTRIDQIWLYLLQGNALSDRQAMVQFKYGAFRSRVAECRDRLHIKDEWDSFKDEQTQAVTTYKKYWMCKEWLKTTEAQAMKSLLERRASLSDVLAGQPFP